MGNSTLSNALHFLPPDDFCFVRECVFIMPLTGTYARNLDDKRRLAVPKRIREDFGDGEAKHLYVAPGTERALLVYSEDGFELMAAQLTARSAQQPELRKYMRLFYSQAERVDFDKQSRIRIPDRLAEFAGLDREIVLLGVHDHAEIWDTVAWDKFLDQNSSDFDNIASQAI